MTTAKVVLTTEFLHRTQIPKIIRTLSTPTQKMLRMLEAFLKIIQILPMVATITYLIMEASHKILTLNIIRDQLIVIKRAKHLLIVKVKIIKIMVLIALIPTILIQKDLKHFQKCNPRGSSKVTANNLKTEKPLKAKAQIPPLVI